MNSKAKQSCFRNATGKAGNRHTQYIARRYIWMSLLFEQGITTTPAIRLSVWNAEKTNIDIIVIQKIIHDCVVGG